MRPHAQTPAISKALVHRPSEVPLRLHRVLRGHRAGFLPVFNRTPDDSFEYGFRPQWRALKKRERMQPGVVARLRAITRSGNGSHGGHGGHGGQSRHQILGEFRVQCILKVLTTFQEPDLHGLQVSRGLAIADRIEARSLVFAVPGSCGSGAFCISFSHRESRPEEDY